MPNSIFNSPDTPGTFDRKLAAVPFTVQQVAVANGGRTYAYIGKLGCNDKMWVSFGQPRRNGPGSIPLDQLNPSVDSSVIPELTQAAIFLCGDAPFAEFTFIEVAAVQSAQS